MSHLIRNNKKVMELYCNPGAPFDTPRLDEMVRSVKQFNVSEHYVAHNLPCQKCAVHMMINAFTVCSHYIGKCIYVCIYVCG